MNTIPATNPTQTTNDAENKSILLVKLAYTGSFFNFFASFPAGLGYISEALTFNGIDHDVYDIQLNGEGDGFVDKIKEYDPDIIGFSMMSYCYLDNYAMISQIKKQFPDKTIVIGGAHASTFKEQILEECEGADIIVLMEGEEPTTALCKGVPLNQIKGIIYRDETGEIANTGPGEIMQDLDKYPFPKLEKFETDRYSMLPIVTSRGCYFGCTFCTVSISMGRAIRYRSADTIIEELEYWQSRGQDVMQVNDDIFTADKDRVAQLCTEIKKRNLSINLTLTNGVRADQVDFELLKLMKESGFVKLAFGVEGGNDKVLRILCKGEKMATIERAIQWAVDLDFEIELFFVIGPPGETEEDILDSIKIATKYPVVAAPFNHLVPFPGTRLYKWVEENDRFLHPAPMYLNESSPWFNEPAFTTDELNVEQRQRMHKLANTIVSKHTRNVYNQRLAKQLSEKFHAPTAAILPFIAAARNPKVRKALETAGVWGLMRKAIR